MSLRRWVGSSFVVAALCAAGWGATAHAQGYPVDGPGTVPMAPPPAAGAWATPLDWVPPALQQLNAEASSRTSFTLDRSMLSAAAGLGGPVDDDTRRAINHLDGVSVHLLRFSDESFADPVLLDEVRDGYHLGGWKHVVSAGGRSQDGNQTDVWMAMDGTNLRAAVVLLQTPREITLATVTGNLSPLDLLHLRGHFGIPRFDGDRLQRQP